MSLLSKIHPKDVNSADEVTQDEELAQNTPVQLREDEPTTLLAMNLDPVIVRKSSYHVNKLAIDAEKLQQGLTAEGKDRKPSVTKLEVPDHEPATSLWEQEDDQTCPNAEFLQPAEKPPRRSFNGSMVVPVNKMSIKLYGSEKAVLREQARMMQAGKWIVHPYSNFRFIWDCISLVLLLANIILIPFAIAFWKEDDQVSWIVFKVEMAVLILDYIS